MRRITPFVVLAIAALTLAGCQRIRTRLGIGESITNPEAGTPEKVIQDVLKTGKVADEEEGWQQFVALLHSEETELPSSLNNWREFKYRAIRKKADLLLTDRIAYHYKLMDRREEGKSLMLFVANSSSDMPTPCRVKQDPAQGNAWRVSGACF
ncbi:MAG: hypothetical protein FJ087_04885 [Deltaproteobacteria bacterium]|nr:hypothetical protein [Deltaproteobacteria bacterium]